MSQTARFCFLELAMFTAVIGFVQGPGWLGFMGAALAFFWFTFIVMDAAREAN